MSDKNVDNIYLAALQMVTGIGSVRIKKLTSYFGSAQQAWQANERDLFLSGCLNEGVYNNLLADREKIDVYNLSREWEKKGIKLCSINDDEYPEMLRHIYNPPMLLFYRGQLNKFQHAVAIVGSRKSSAYGKNVAHMLAADLAAAGIAVVSGAARGIDSAAHQGALTKGYTIAVLGCGVDIVYPPENSKLISSIIESGAVVSEYAPGTKVHQGHFPARNRIINGISHGVVVIEAAEKSGALITADFALEEGRDVFAVPGSVFSASSKGCHRLIKQGAKLVESAADILEEYDVTLQKKDTETITLSQDEIRVYEVLEPDNPLSIEEIIMKTKLTATSATYILLQLELRGLAVENSGGCYIRTAREGIW